MNRSGPYNKPGAAYHHGDLARATVLAGFELLEERGPHAFTLAEVGKRIRVSTAALYRHFADKDALLARLATECFRSFEAKLKRVGPGSGPERLRAMTLAYLTFAGKHPARYALMFGAQLEHAKYPELGLAGDRAFAALVDVLKNPTLNLQPEAIEPTAIQVWAQCHGLASLKAGLALGLGQREVRELAVSGVAAIVERAMHTEYDSGQKASSLNSTPRPIHSPRPTCR